MRARKVDRYKLALIKAAELDDSGFDWRGIDLSDPHVQMLAQQDHGKGVRHPGLGCCE
jgi:hypothetical protein